MKYKSGLVALFVLVYSPINISLAQDKPAPPPCSADEFGQFDFWIGSWDLTWNDSLHGSNTISKDYNDCVIMEKFNGNPGSDFRGMSISTYDVRSKLWKQTWVDDQGSYLDFSGGMAADSMILSRSFVNNEGKTILQRMVWYNITANSFDWNWEKSADSGHSWQTAWHIEYYRSAK